MSRSVLEPEHLAKEVPPFLSQDPYKALTDAPFRWAKRRSPMLQQLAPLALSLPSSASLGTSGQNVVVDGGKHFY